MHVLRKSLCRSLRQLPFASVDFTTQLPKPYIHQLNKPLSFGNLIQLIDSLPSRETWFCFYQPHPSGTAFLYEYDAPLDNEVYVKQVAPKLHEHFGRPARESYLHVVNGESFANCDVARPPWFSYRLQLSGVRVGQRLGPYAADDVVAPNRVTLLLQERWRNNIRDVQDVVNFLAVPTEARLKTHLQHLVAVAHQDSWHKGPDLVHLLLTQHWGQQVLHMHGITAMAVRRAYALYGIRTHQKFTSGYTASSEWRRGGGVGSFAVEAAAERRMVRRLQREALARESADPDRGVEGLGRDIEGLRRVNTTMEAKATAEKTAADVQVEALKGPLQASHSSRSDKAARWRS